MCELLLNRGAEVKVLDIARRSPDMLARRNEHYDVLAVLAKFHTEGDDEDRNEGDVLAVLAKFHN
jgi:hypothetical protein